MHLSLFHINFVSALVSLAAAWFAWRRRDRPAAAPLFVLGLAAGYWALCAAFEFQSTSLAAKTFWLTAKYPGIVIVPLAVASLVLRVSGWRGWPRPAPLAVLSIFPALTLALVFSNSSHHLFWESIRLQETGAHTTLLVEPGPWFWVHAIYSYGLILASTSAAFTTMARLRRVYGPQILRLSLALTAPLIANLASLTDFALIPGYNGLDLSPASFGLAALLLLLATNQGSMLDVVPLAYAALIEQFSDGFLIMDERDRILDLNQAAEQVLRQTRQELIGRSLTEIKLPPLQALRSIPHAETIQREVRVLDGHTARWFEWRVTPLIGDDSRPAGRMVIWHDITRRKQIEADLRHASTHDQLTGLYNRLFFEEEFDRIGRGRHWPVTVIVGDLDNLKETNDSQGHLAGDALLRDTAETFRICLRSGDLLARIGGDEFAVVLPECDQDGAEGLLSRLRQAVDAHNLLRPDLPIEISLGASVATNTDELDSALHEADAAMYADKGQRKI